MKDGRLHVAALLDGRPGHEKQTLGVVEALGRLVPLHLTRLAVSRPSLSRRLADTLRLWLPGAGMAAGQLAGVDLLLGTGSSTHLPLLLYKKRYRVPAVTCMSPSPHLRRGFDLCFVPEHDGLAAAGNVVLTLGAPNTLEDLGEHQEDRGLILIGGIDRSSHHWHGEEVVRMVREIVTSSPFRTWVVASSPRTPAATVTLLATLANSLANARFFPYQATGPGWIEERYQESRVAWVTADSISMMYEALAAGCRLGILPLRWRRQKSKFQTNLELLLARGFAHSYAAWSSHRGDWQQQTYPNEARKCAERILQIWPKEK
jgi:uncharacterized protein